MNISMKDFELNPDAPQFIRDTSAGALRNKDVSTLAAGAVINLFGRVSGRGLYALLEVILARMLGPADFGLFSIGLNLLRIVGILGTLGLHNGVIRYGARYWRTSPADLRRTIRSSIGVAFTSGVFIGGVLYVIAPWLAISAFQKPELIMVFRGFAFAFPFTISMWVGSAATRISKRMKFSVITEDFAQPAVNLALVMIFFFFGLTLAWAVILNVISQIVAFLFSVLFVWLLFYDALTSRASASLKSKELIFYSIPTGLAGSFTVITNWIGRLFVGYFNTAAEAGIYQSASQVTILFVLVLSSLNAIFSPMIVDLYHRNDIDRIGELYRISTKWGLSLVTPLFIVICFVPRELMITVFGQAYASGSVALIFLSVAQMINIGSGAVGFLLTMTGHQNRWFVISSLSLAASLLLNIILVPRFGMLGAAIVNCITVSGLFLIGLIQVKVQLKLWPYDRRYLKGVKAVSIVVGALIFINGWTNSFPPPAQVLILSIVSYGLFGGVLLALGLDSEDRKFIQLLSNRLPNRKSNSPISR